MKRRVVIPVLLAASVVVCLAGGPTGTFGFLLRTPIMLINDLISVVRQAFAPPNFMGIYPPQPGTPPVSTSALAASLQLPEPLTTPAPPSTQPSPPPGSVVLPPPNDILAPVEEVLSPAQPVLDPVQNAVDPTVDSVEKTLEPATGSVENAAGSATEPVERAAGGAVHDVKGALDKIGAP